MNRRTKIVATIGPASDDPTVIERLLLAGMDVARVNFSHGSYDEHALRISRLRTIAGRLGRPLAILQDLQGPKLRTGDLSGGGPVTLHAGQRFVLTNDSRIGDVDGVSTSYRALAHDVVAGNSILLSDGLIELRVMATHGDMVETEVVSGGNLRGRQGMHLPGVSVSAPSMTDKDVNDLAFGLDQGVDWVALSFVRRADDIMALRERIAAAGHDTPVVAKIEKPEALRELPAILRQVDGLMVARGDLGVEMPIAQVPEAQKQIIAQSNAAGVPVITATEMLQSMIDQPRPTRAEASDVANAIIDGSDAVMLSGETAIGRYPVESVATMAAVAAATDAAHRRALSLTADPSSPARGDSVSEAVAAAACGIAHQLALRAIVIYTVSGATARRAARLRPLIPIVALTPSELTYRRLCLSWGVTPILCDRVEEPALLLQIANNLLMRHGHAQPGDRVVVTAGYPFVGAGSTNLINVMPITG